MTMDYSPFELKGKGVLHQVESAQRLGITSAVLKISQALRS